MVKEWYFSVCFWMHISEIKVVCGIVVTELFALVGLIIHLLVDSPSLSEAFEMEHTYEPESIFFKSQHTDNYYFYKQNVYGFDIDWQW